MRPVVGRRASQAARGPARETVTNRVRADCALGSFGIDGRDLLAIPGAGLGQGQIDQAVDRARIALDDGPIGLLRPPPREGAGQARGGARRLAQDQDAGGVAVEAVGQARALQPLAPGAQQPVDVLGVLAPPCTARPAGLLSASTSSSS